MSLSRYLQKLRQLDFLIGKKATGDQKSLARRMQMSRSGLNALLNEMKEIGFPIKYDHIRRTYFYEKNGSMVEALFEEELSKEKMKNIHGGLSLIPSSYYLYTTSYLLQSGIEA